MAWPTPAPGAGDAVGAGTDRGPRRSSTTTCPDSRRKALRLAVKRGLDTCAAAGLLVLLAPLVLLIAIAIKADGSPAFYVHRRVGLHGRSFGCLKFRTMACDSERLLRELLEHDPAARQEWADTRKLRHDPRVTRLGRILRATSLDELPQLLNVLRGEMSLVGPRPVVASELTTFYGAAARHYISVRPGITGLWQVSGRSDTGYSRRVLLDTLYVQRLSLRRDFRILLQTVVVVLRAHGAR